MAARILTKKESNEDRIKFKTFISKRLVNREIFESIDESDPELHVLYFSDKKYPHIKVTDYSYNIRKGKDDTFEYYNKKDNSSELYVYSDDVSAYTITLNHLSKYRKKEACVKLEKATNKGHKFIISSECIIRKNMNNYTRFIMAGHSCSIDDDDECDLLYSVGNTCIIVLFTQNKGLPYIFHIDHDSLDNILNKLQDILTYNFSMGYFDSRFATFNIENVQTTVTTDLKNALLSDAINRKLDKFNREVVKYDSNGNVIYYECPGTHIKMSISYHKDSEYKIDYTEYVFIDEYELSSRHVYGNDEQNITIDTEESGKRSHTEFTSLDGKPILNGSDNYKYVSTLKSDDITTTANMIFDRGNTYFVDDPIIDHNSEEEISYDEPQNIMLHDGYYCVKTYEKSIHGFIDSKNKKLSLKSTIKYYGPDNFNYLTIYMYDNCIIKDFYIKDTAESHISRYMVHATLDNMKFISYDSKSIKFTANTCLHDGSPYYASYVDDDNTRYEFNSYGNIISCSSDYLTKDDPAYIRDEFGIPRLYTPSLMVIRSL